MIFTTIRNKFKDLTVASGLAAANVDVDRMDDIPTDKLPYARIYTGDTEIERLFKGGTGNFLNQQEVMIELFHKRSSTTPVQEQLDTLVGNLRAQIETDTTLAGTVRDCVPTKIECETNGAHDDVYGKATFTCLVTFHTSSGAES